MESTENAVVAGARAVEDDARPSDGDRPAEGDDDDDDDGPEGRPRSPKQLVSRFEQHGGP